MITVQSPDLFVLQKEMVDKFQQDNFPLYLDFIESRLKENNDGTGFYVGNSVR